VQGGELSINNRKTNFRFNILSTIIYIIGIILFLQLFNLQIMHGEEYAEESNTRLTRESTLEASRGSIVDKTGNALAITEMGFSLELFKSKIENEDLNNAILNMINLLEKNGDKYVDSFPINVEPFEFEFSSEEKAVEWKKAYKINESANAEECFNFFKEKYRISNQDIFETRKIIAIRYEITKNGYSSIKSIKISSNISRASALEFNERSNSFPRYKCYSRTC